MTLVTVRSAEPRHWLQAIDFLASRRDRFPFEAMITARYDLEHVNDALQAMASYQVVKAVIDLN
jgi:Zn-dependent alcohol dehydrogenase